MLTRRDERDQGGDWESRSPKVTRRGRSARGLSSRVCASTGARRPPTTRGLSSICVRCVVAMDFSDSRCRSHTMTGVTHPLHADTSCVVTCRVDRIQFQPPDTETILRAPLQCPGPTPVNQASTPFPNKQTHLFGDALHFELLPLAYFRVDHGLDGPLRLFFEGTKGRRVRISRRPRSIGDIVETNGTDGR